MLSRRPRLFNKAPPAAASFSEHAASSALSEKCQSFSPKRSWCVIPASFPVQQPFASTNDTVCLFVQELEFNQGSIYSEEERDAIMRVFSANAPSCGPEVLAFEKEFSHFVGSTHAIAVGNATQGLEIAARAAIAVWTGDGAPEIVVPSISWISTASAAALAGATVKFADVSPQTLCADVESIKSLVTTRTAAVMIVHLFGRPADGVSDLAAWLRARGVVLIEDCAHAVAAVDGGGSMCGAIGDIGVFSFHQQKNMVTLGEGGMCVTSNPRLRELMTGYRSLCAMSYDPKGKYLTLNSELHPMDQRYWIMVSVKFHLAALVCSKP